MLAAANQQEGGNVISDEEYFENVFHADPNDRVVVRWDVHVKVDSGETTTHTGVTLLLHTGFDGAGGTAELRTGRSAPEGHPEAFVETGGQDAIIEEMNAVDTVQLVEGGLVVRGKAHVQGGQPLNAAWFAVPYRFPAP